MRILRAIILATVLLWLSCFAATARPPRDREHFEHVTVTYDWVTNHSGQKLRTFVTRPNDSPGKVPVIFFVGWLSCDSMEYPDPDNTDGFGTFMHRLIEKSGYATVRMDKPGVGESEGDCGKANFRSEIEGFQAAFDAMAKYPFIDLERIFVVGLSNGGGFSPMAVGDHPVRGYVSCGSWGRTWYEHMLDLERRRLLEENTSPAEINTAVKAYVPFYELYLMRGMTPGQVIAQHPEWKALWHDSPDGQYGRPAAFYQQLQALNLGEVWQKVNAPVLVIRGTGDNIMSRSDSETIVRTVNQSHPGHARYLQIDDMTHGFTVSDKFYDPVIPEVLTWMKENLSSSK
jgi:pimeloyl-ACP methyl ester carboxylesterase